ncbi:MAG: hypothetical protein MR957_11720 [Lachnobacterium sp.]|nr:hypothetical protein [Lachnobacterium sp.]
MKTTLRIDRSNDYDKCRLKELNELLNPYGITFTPDTTEYTNTRTQKTAVQDLLHIEVDETILHSTRSEAKAGRPPKKIDYDKIVELKRKDFDVSSICKELGISRALYYREVVTSIDSLAIGTRVTYRPIDEETWYTGTVMINDRNTKYVQGDDGIADYPRRSDVIRML